MEGKKGSIKEATEVVNNWLEDEKLKARESGKRLEFFVQSNTKCKG